MRASEIRGRGDHYRLLLSQIWKAVGEQLLGAKSEEDAIKAFDPVPFYKKDFAPIAWLIPKVLRDPRFPKRRKAQIKFLADSLAGRGSISPRRSRDICERERAKPIYYIIRQDFYIGCTCGYEGPALHGACPECGTENLALPHAPFTS